MSRIEWKRIVCPVDFSEPSRGALAVAVEVARRFDAELTLFHAHERPGVILPTGDLLVTPAMMADIEIHVERLLGELKREAESLGATNVKTAQGMGTAFVEIIRFARDGCYDLIVMGTHGRSALKHALLGSVTEKVVRSASCPVLTIRHEGHRFEAP